MAPIELFLLLLIKAPGVLMSRMVYLGYRPRHKLEICTVTRPSQKVSDFAQTYGTVPQVQYLPPVILPTLVATVWRFHVTVVGTTVPGRRVPSSIAN